MGSCAKGQSATEVSDAASITTIYNNNLKRRCKKKEIGDESAKNGNEWDEETKISHDNRTRRYIAVILISTINTIFIY